MVIIESKSILEYLTQLQELGEDIKEYEGLFGYSLGETERTMPVFQYPEYDFDVTDSFTNFERAEQDWHRKEGTSVGTIDRREGSVTFARSASIPH